MSNRNPSTPRNPRRALPALAALIVAVAAGSPVTASASDATLRATLNSASHTIAIDAHSIALAAKRRHPRRMSFSARRFHNDAARARTAINHQHPSSAKGLHAKSLALQAFANYAKAGTSWAASGNARLAHHTTAATTYAHQAATAAAAGNRVLIAAGKLLR